MITPSNLLIVQVCKNTKLYNFLKSHLIEILHTILWLGIKLRRPTLIPCFVENKLYFLNRTEGPILYIVFLVFLDYLSFHVNLESKTRTRTKIKNQDKEPEPEPEPAPK